LNDMHNAFATIAYAAPRT